ncbi:LOW QUALITY PROTEIN: hypothetical protein QTO34_001315 [Cnephaeus nilssonii]|uniref:Zinc finger protein 292 n=1 Tax=Cnephaeus nilssonii TaxID=3371016 RepID=A0AA40HVG4_CNENI|nr:LOW QUALITY PROTEIN: hypothetical protein QTO34_001315 [Eptesicus nilssonii]
MDAQRPQWSSSKPTERRWHGIRPGLGSSPATCPLHSLHPLGNVELPVLARLPQATPKDPGFDKDGGGQAGQDTCYEGEGGGRRELQERRSGRSEAKTPAGAKRREDSAWSEVKTPGEKPADFGQSQQEACRLRPEGYRGSSRHSHPLMAPAPLAPAAGADPNRSAPSACVNRASAGRAWERQRGCQQTGSGAAAGGTERGCRGWAETRPCAYHSLTAHSSFGCKWHGYVAIQVDAEWTDERAVRRRPRPSESLRRCGGFRKALRRSRQAARSPALAFDRGGPVRLAVRRRPRPSESLRRCGGFRKALRRSRQAARSPALAFDRGGPVRLAVRRRPRPSESLRRCGGFRKALRRSRQAARSPALAFDRGGPVRLAVRRRPRPSESLRRCGGFRKALRRSRQAARSPALAFDRGGPVRLAVRRRPRPSESLRRCGGFRKALRRSRQAARSPALAFDRGGPVRLAVRRRPRPSESLRRCGGFRKALRRSRQAARSPALAFDRGGPVRLAAPQAFRKPPAAMVQTLSSRRQRRRELSVLLAQSATPATLSPAPCASCWPNRGRSGVMSHPATTTIDQSLRGGGGGRRGPKGRLFHRSPVPSLAPLPPTRFPVRHAAIGACGLEVGEPLDKDKVNEFLAFEGPILLDMRIKHLIKTNQLSQATALAKLCSDHPEIGTKGSFKQTYLVCLCTSSPNEKLIEEISEVDCKDALEMICNLESEGDEKNALVLCTAFLSRQLQQGEMYCAWELTLFWSKLQQRVEPSVHVYLERCRQLSLLTKTVYHIFFLIKVINSETEGAGLATCIELCVKALRLESTENTEVKISICKTISCLLPDDLEVKRACQLSEFLIEPTVDAYYAVEMLYNQPDQKYDEENLPIPNSLRCELLLVLKTQWPFDPEFWDWKTLKRQCLALMGEEASIVSSIDELNDSEVYEKVVDYQEETKETSVNGLSGGVGANSGLLCDEKQKKREIKQLRERGFISARFRNWQAYMQYCVLCDKEFLGHRIVRHAQKHYKDGIYSCPICAKNFNSKETFVPHVTLHVKQSSKERLAAMKPLRRLGRPPKITTTNDNQKINAVTKQEQRPIKKNSLYSTDFIVFNDNDGSDDENDDKDKSYEPEVIPVQKPVPVNEFNCPVTFCKKGFKYFKNLIAHVKGHKDNEDAKRFLEMQSKKVICQYCRRHFVSVTHLNDHLQMHCGSKPYICIQMKCKAGFNSYAELLTHRKEHQVFRAKCMFPKCGRIFSEAYLLYDHEAQHYNTYTCKFTGCGKVYRSQSELEKHLDDHSTPEKALPPEDQLNSSGASVQLSKMNQNSEGTTEKESSMLSSQDNVESTLSTDRSEAWDKSNAESAVAKQDHISASELRQADEPLSNGLENPAATPLLQASEVAVSIKVSLNQGIEDNFGKQENSTVEDTGESLVTNIHTVVEDTCNDLCHPSFQERKEQDCFNEAQITQNSLVNSETLKIGDLTPQNLERQVNNLMTFSVQNQTGFQNSLPTSKFECGGNVKTSANLYNLPLKTLESITFVPPQPNLSSLGTPSVPPKAPVQKFSCQVEGCTRTYNSSQSIGKHMKTAHPDQYAAFKMQCKSKKGQKSNNLNVPNNGKFVYFLPSQVSSSNNAFFTPQTKANGNSTCSDQLQHVSSSIFPAQLASVSTPLLPSVESVINPNLPSQDKNEQGGSMLCSQMENLSNTTLPAQMEDLTKTVLPLNIDSGSDPFLPLPAESSSMSLFPSPADSGTNSVFSQLENNTSHFSSQIEGNTNSSFLKGGNVENAVFPSQVNVANDFSSTSTQQSAPEKVKKDRGRGPNGKERKPKHNKRAKWPAIIRDGKFICSRCYRAFTNPRSLGGHLSKRSYCKPLDGAEIAQELLQSNGQPSLLASMILSTNAINLQQPQQSTFNPETCFKDPSFLQLLAAENRSSTFLPNTFPRTGVTNFNTSVSQEGSEIIKQALETAGIPSTFEGAEMLSQAPAGCVSDAAQVNATVIPNPAVPPTLLQTVCHPNSLLTSQNRTPNSKTPSIEECSSLPIFPTNDLLLKTVENGLCSSTFPNSSGPSQNFTSSSSRVSVISGPQNTRSSHLNKKGNSASKRRKKVTPPLIAPNASQNLVTSDLTAMGLIAKSIEIPANLHSNVIPNCEPQALVENLTQKLSNVDNQLFLTDVKENFKTNLESHTVLAPLPLKTENGDSQMMALNSCTTSISSDLQITEDNVIQNFEKTLEIIKSAMNSQILEVKSGSQGVGETSQNAQINYNIQLPLVNTVQNNKLPDSSQFSSFVGGVPTKSNIPQSEVFHKEDQIQEILEGLQKLKLENDLSTPASQCVLTNTSVTLTPVPVKAIPNVTVVQPVSEMINIQFIDKVNKPFVCQNQGCNYSAMTKDALFKHYGKIHQYTPEMILEIKKNQLKFAPFKCVVPTCTKTFTRNSNLRAHCQLVHHFTTEEMVKLKNKKTLWEKISE